MKTKLRKALKDFRNSLKDREIRDRIITDYFLSSSLFENAETVLLYYSSGSEVSTREIFSQCLNAGKRVAFPVCRDKNGNMDFYLVNDETDLEEGMYGIREPKKSCKKLESDEKCLCVVPGIAFEKHGYRLGYGKGYYDRYLSSFKGVSVGLCYALLHCSQLPVDKYDMKVNYLITDNAIYNYNSKEDLKNG